ncbi:hypothetical protein Pst134EA_011984 [Puccinia striiformis f. sp. tritici]|nr:hypothetical protein Pst134EA_011984 [Puccinia striiformis f. sp. tritici]KAH9468361.1 hypothetical protein Pst134EA_011984 [Puccinia striiformis f. sp. tritici]
MSMISRHQPKGQTYARYLDSVRSAGSWSTAAPITAKGALITPASNPSEVGTGLSWPEIIRKYLKHNPERALTAEVATTELALRLLLASADQAVGYDHDKIHLDDDPESGQSTLPPLVRTEDRDAAKQHVSKLIASLAKHITNEADPKLPSEQNAANIVISFGHYVAGDYDQCLQNIQKCTFVLPETVDLNSDRYYLILLVLGLTVKALAQQRNGAESSVVLEAYSQVMEVYDLCLGSLSISTMDDLHIELHGWAELAMYRACILSRVVTPGIASLEMHRCYHSRSRCWPLPFRLNKRGVIHKSYIQLLFMTARSDSWRSSVAQPSNEYSEVSISTVQDGESITVKQHGVAWRSELITIAKSYHAILRMTTTFPKAGSTNHLVLEFCDMLYEGWQLGGLDPENTSQIIDMFHDATRKTFHSQKILRYLVQLLDAQRDWDEAEAALDLYCQLHITASANSKSDSSEPDNSRPLVSGEAPSNGNGVTSPEEKKGANAIVPNRDTDEDFIRTMIYGSRMLIKFVNNPEKATELLDRANEVMKTTKVEGVRNDAFLKSRLARMRGIAAGACAQKADQETRPALHTSYLEFLTEAAESDPSSFENMYHLAYAQAELRDIDSALVSARTAVEINPNHTSAWHLLCLLTSASKEFKLALDIAEVGLVNTEDLDEGEFGMRTPKAGSSTNLSRDSSLPGTILTDESPAVTSETSAAMITSTSKPTAGLIADPPVEPGVPTQQAIGEGRLSVPTINSARPNNQDNSLTPTLSHCSYQTNNTNNTTKLEFHVPKADNLEASIQLRMTKNMLIEALQGPEVALSDQQTLFAFFAQIYSQIHSQDAPQMTHSQSQSQSLSQPQSQSKSTGASSLFLHDKHLPSSSSSTSRSNTRGSRLKVKRPTFDNRVSNSIRRRAHMPSSTHLHKQRVISGENDLAALTQEMADIVIKQEERKSDLANLKSIKILQDLWLISAATFRRWGKSDECKGAIREAESLNGESPDLWVQYALYCLSISDLNQAIDSLTKALGFDDQHISAIIHLARIFKEQGSIELAEGLLDVLTQTVAWDIPEAWYLLAEIYLSTQRLKHGKDSLIFSLGLEETKPIRPLRICLPSCL